MWQEIREVASKYFYEVVTAIIILFIGFGLGILVKKLLARLLKEVGLNKVMAKVSITQDVEKGISIGVSSLIYVITIIIFLRQLGLQSVVLYLILGAVLMLMILTLMVGLKDVIPNLVGWVALQRKGTIKEGRRVQIREIEGVVEHIGYLETEIKTEQGDILCVPNSLFMKSKYRLNN